KLIYYNIKNHNFTLLLFWCKIKPESGTESSIRATESTWAWIQKTEEMKDEGIDHRRRSGGNQGRGQTETGGQKPGYYHPDQGQGYLLRGLRSSLLCRRSH